MEETQEEFDRAAHWMRSQPSLVRSSVPLFAMILTVLFVHTLARGQIGNSEHLQSAAYVEECVLRSQLLEASSPPALQFALSPVTHWSLNQKVRSTSSKPEVRRFSSPGTQESARSSFLTLAVTDR